MSERKTDQESVRLSSDLIEQLEKIAKETNTSVQEVICAAIKHAQDSKGKP